MFKKLFVVLLVLIVGFLGFVAMQPADFSVERSTTIKAPTAAVYEQINSFENFQTWSPWAKVDPEAKYDFEGPKAGVGSVMKWSGNEEVGAGSLAIVESDSKSGVKQKLTFTKPFQSENDVGLTMQAVSDSETKLTWSMSGTHNFVGKAMGLFMDMDQMIGSMYEQGLETLKEKLETPTEVPPTEPAK